MGLGCDRVLDGGMRMRPSVGGGEGAIAHSFKCSLYHVINLVNLQISLGKTIINLKIPQYSFS